MAKENKVKSTSAISRERLRRFLVRETGGCVVQDGWPCGTCFMEYLDRLGLDKDKADYRDANDPPDRHNEVWRAILQIREATT
jgi:hypothetical protein